MLEYLTTLFSYNAWANQQVLQAAEQLTVSELDTPVQIGHSTIRSTLVHIINAEWLWSSRWQGVSPTYRLDPDHFPTMAPMMAREHLEQKHIEEFLSDLKEEDLYRDLSYKSTQGELSSIPLWRLMLHMINHSTQHRSEVALILTELGYSPGELDLLEYYYMK